MKKNQIKKQCLNCKEVFFRPHSKADRPFCSRKCSGEHQSKQGNSICVCRHCRKEVLRRNSRPGEFCSVKCSALFHAQPRRELIICRVCGAAAHKEKFLKAKYCSAKCNLAHVATRSSKRWVIKSPRGVIYRPINLLDFVERNPELFTDIPRRKTSMGKRMSSGFRGCGEWLGWIMLRPPTVVSKT